MACDLVRTSEGGVAIVCGGGRRRKSQPPCYNCGSPSAVQCDHPGCDRYCCLACSVAPEFHVNKAGNIEKAKDIDFCLEHVNFAL